MFFYILAIVSASFFAYLYQRHSKGISYRGISIESRDVYLFISFAILFILSGLRRNVGTDYYSYEKWFIDIAGGSITYFEPGFAAMNRIVANYTHNPIWIFILSSLITLGIIFLTIRKYSSSVGLSILLFCSMSFLFYSFNATRQFIAIAIVFSTWGIIKNRRLVKYVLYIILAGLFHKSALVMIPFFFLLNFKYRAYHYLAIILFSFVSLYFRSTLIEFLYITFPLLKVKYINFSGQIIYSELFLGTCIFMTALIYLLIKYDKISYDDSETRISINTLFYILVLNTGLSWIPLVARFGFYLEIFLLIVIPYLFSKISDSSLRTTTGAFYIVLTIIYTTISIGYNNSHNVLPYDSVLIPINGRFE